MSLLCAAAVLALSSCSTSEYRPPRPQAPQQDAAAPGKLVLRREANPELDNLIRVSESIYSGGEPHGEESFAELARLGVKTVVSVDGGRPDLASAKAHGLRYVHIPIGYDRVTNKAGRTLARLVREAEEPFYIHCHHGRHRGPAAAALACIAAGEANNAGARKLLELAGTSEDYAGLWRDVAAYRPPPEGVELPELADVVEVGSFVAAMAMLDRAYDDLKRCRDANWSAPRDHPDVVPVRAALILREGLHESGRMLGTDGPTELRQWLADAETLAGQLESALASGDAVAADAAFRKVVASCKGCHKAYRN